MVSFIGLFPIGFCSFFRLLFICRFVFHSKTVCVTVAHSIQAFANQWKDWGNELWKKDDVQFTAEYYSLAIKFLPGTNAQLRAKLLSNRSKAYLRRGAFPKAQKDARDCIGLWPEWFRVRHIPYDRNIRTVNRCNTASVIPTGRTESSPYSKWQEYGTFIPELWWRGKLTSIHPSID